jgi:hypothetical protein
MLPLVGPYDGMELLPAPDEKTPIPMSTEARPPAPPIAEDPPQRAPKRLPGLWIICVLYALGGMFCLGNALSMKPLGLAVYCALAVAGLAVAAALYLRLRAGWYVAMVLLGLQYAGKLPGSLDALAPAYLKAVPLDAFTGKPFGCEPTGKGPRIWSGGPDQVAGKSTDEGGDDVVVTVTFSSKRAEAPADEHSGGAAAPAPLPRQARATGRGTHRTAP